jgi:hypothetical protein
MLPLELVSRLRLMVPPPREPVEPTVTVVFQGVEFELTVAVIVWLAVVKVTVWSAEVAVL